MKYGRFEIGDYVQLRGEPKPMMRVAENNADNDWFEEDGLINCVWEDHSTAPPTLRYVMHREADLEPYDP